MCSIWYDHNGRQASGSLVLMLKSINRFRACCRIIAIRHRYKIDYTQRVGQHANEWRADVMKNLLERTIVFWRSASMMQKPIGHSRITPSDDVTESYLCWMENCLTSLIIASVDIWFKLQTQTLVHTQRADRIELRLFQWHSTHKFQPVVGFYQFLSCKIKPEVVLTAWWRSRRNLALPID